MSGEADPAEPEAAARRPILACCRPGRGNRRIHGVELGSKVALCGAIAGDWQLLPEQPLGCPKCLGKLARVVRA